MREFMEVIHVPYSEAQFPFGKSQNLQSLIIKHWQTETTVHELRLPFAALVDILWPSSRLDC
jgi:hypothetical protein